MGTITQLDINALFGIGAPIVATIGAIISFANFYRQDLRMIKRTKVARSC